MTGNNRKPFIGGNWKSNGSVKSVRSLLEALVNECNRWDADNVDVVLAPCALHVGLTSSLLDTKFQLALQNVCKFGPGAYTGEIAAEMAKDSGIRWALVGHSERRHKFGETLEDTSMKIAACQAAGVGVIFCVGELLGDREAGKTMDVCKEQIEAVLSVVKDWNEVVIAYEPVWAIGTGVVATSEQAQEAHASIRALLAEKTSLEVASKTRILYGGSVTPENCVELMKMDDVDGFLVGGASLKPSFSDIIVAASQV